MMKLFSAVTDFVGFSMILIDFTMKKKSGKLKNDELPVLHDRSCSRVGEPEWIGRNSCNAVQT